MKRCKSNKLFLTISEDAFSNIPQEIRKSFEVLKVEPNDKDLFKDDSHYSQLMKDYKKASKELRDYQYNIRHEYRK